MPLTNFGAILNFAERIECEDMDYYRGISEALTGDEDRRLYETFAAEGKKLVALVQRTRRENVTEMILEPIRDFERGSYVVPMEDGAVEDAAAARRGALSREARAVGYYSDASRKIRALPEVSRALKTLGKKRARRLDQLQRLD